VGVCRGAAATASLTIERPIRNHSAGWFALYNHRTRAARVTDRHNIDVPPLWTGRHHRLPDFLVCHTHKGGCDLNLVGYVIGQSLCSRDGLCNRGRIVPYAARTKLRLPSLGHFTCSFAIAPLLPLKCCDAKTCFRAALTRFIALKYRGKFHGHL
jgi:hypothetical protein